jgi:hypothetical protein
MISFGYGVVVFGEHALMRSLLEALANYPIIKRSLVYLASILTDIVRQILGIKNLDAMSSRNSADLIPKRSVTAWNSRTASL